MVGEQAVTAEGRITVLGVETGDPRALVELARWTPADATALYRVPSLASRARRERTSRSNPPGVLVSSLGRVRGSRAERGGLADVVEAAAAELDVPIRVLDPATDAGVVPRNRWWTVGAWAVTVLAAAVPIAAVAAVLLRGGLLLAAVATLAAIAAAALLVGFALAHEAAGIRRGDAAAAALIARDVPDDENRPVVVVPARNAAGVAAALRDRGIDAGARRVTAGVEPDAAARPHG